MIMMNKIIFTNDFNIHSHSPLGHPQPHPDTDKWHCKKNIEFVAFSFYLQFLFVIISFVFIFIYFCVFDIPVSVFFHTKQMESHADIDSLSLAIHVVLSSSSFSVQSGKQTKKTQTGKSHWLTGALCWEQL